ncbi:hypothetical protein [Streptomyces sp. NPDC053367]|uniref:hypothetical protein n=1 Tax=Streptomyces sp. NPDC053367 TaxID=3365700 RepID=UPI0037D550B4
MPEHVSILPWAGVAVLALAAVAWVIGVTRILRRDGIGATTADPRPALSALPRQRQSGPDREAVELTPAEKAAFAGLVRRLADGH